LVLLNSLVGASIYIYQLQVSLVTIEMEHVNDLVAHPCAARRGKSLRGTRSIVSGKSRSTSATHHFQRAIMPGDTASHVVEDCLGVLQLLSGRTVVRSGAAVLLHAPLFDRQEAGD
jgi:hypothetical protein